MRTCSTKSPRNSARHPERGSASARQSALGAGLRFAAVILAFFQGLASAAPVVEFSSGVERVSVIELYTSEGCSSCPPADRWLTGLKEQPGLWQEFVPLAFHVDYWDYIGWRDRFASASNSARQRAYARSGGVSTVYTPGFVVNGREWRGWFTGKSNPASPGRPGKLRARLSGANVSLHYEPGDAQGHYVANVALLGANLASEVSAGENRGRQLLHDFVVVELATVELSGKNGEFTTNLELAINRSTDRPTDVNPAALAVWVTRSDELAPLQATGGWLPLAARAH